jgi:hypothetical protein
MGTLFEALGTQINPGSTPWLAVFFVVGQAGGLSRGGMYSYTVDLALVDLTQGAADLAADLTYGVPFEEGDSWGLIGGVSAGYKVQVALPDTRPATFFSSIFQMDAVEALEGSTVAPNLSPVRNPRIGGQDLFKPVAGVGMDSTLTWDKPQIGSPTSYLVEVYRLESKNGRTTYTSTATLTTPERALTLPPGVLTTGESYAFRIRARLEAASPETPTRPTLPQTIADLITNVVTP